jgi:hypothetical protein
LLEAEAGRPRHIPFGWQIATLDTATAATGHRSVSTLPPAHNVWLSPYFIDIPEIMIDEFNPCVRDADAWPPRLDVCVGQRLVERHRVSLRK